MANFINSQNRNLLLELLIDKSNTNQEYINNINTLLTTTINEIVNKYGMDISKNLKYDAVLNLNRETLFLFKKRFMMYNLNDGNNYSNQIPINIKDREKQKQIQFENNLLKKQQDFESYKPTPPKNISFKDDVTDTHIGENIDSLIAKAIETREKQMRQIFTNPQSMETIPTPSPMPISNNNNKSIPLPDSILTAMNIKKLNIGEETNHIDNIIDLSNTNTEVSSNTNTENNKQNIKLEINDEERKDLNFLFSSLKVSRDTKGQESQEHENYNKYFSKQFIDEKINRFESLLESLDNKIEKLEIILDKFQKVERNIHNIYKNEFKEKVAENIAE